MELGNKYNDLIFLRFRINDFNTPTKVEDTIATIDNIVNYILRNPNNKIMIHCWGGHGRTGLFTCCVLSLILLLLLTPTFKDIMNKIKKKPFDQANILIINLSEKIFKIIQAYIMVNLRAYRKTNWPCIKEIKDVLIPGTHAQDNFVKEVIISYIMRYIEYGFLYNITHNLKSIDGKDLLFQDTNEINRPLSLYKGYKDDSIWVKSGSQKTKELYNS